MRYLGGKSRLAKLIVSAIAPRPGCLRVEPFMGGCNVACAAAIAGCRLVLSDKHPDLCLMWRAVLFDGWTPPSVLSEEHYNALRLENPSALRGFAGFGCSFGGKWFGGYARDGSARNYALSARNSILKKAHHMKGSVVEVECRNYNESTIGDVVYMDPPYAGTTGYAGSGKFDSQGFWSWAGKVENAYVSEYSAPSNWIIHAEFKTKTDLHTKSGKEQRLERIFVHESR